MKGAAILIGILIIIAVLYFTGSWVTGQIDFKRVFGPVYNQSNAPAIPLIKPEKSSITAGAGKTGDRYYIGFQRESPLNQPPEGFTKEQLSPYYQLVDIGSVRRPSSDGYGAEFSVRAASSLKSAVDITNWRVRANKGVDVVIRGDIASSGPINLARIILKPGTAATVYSVVRVANIKNVELNKCTGYLNNVYKLSPALPNNCPRPKPVDFSEFSGSCQNFVNSLASCESPTSADRARFTSSEDAACFRFLSTLNYEGCSARYSGDPDFWNYGWRIWLDQIFPFDRFHDRLLLLDANGGLVDIYSY